MFGSIGLVRDRRDLRHQMHREHHTANKSTIPTTMKDKFLQQLPQIIMATSSSSRPSGIPKKDNE